MGTRVNLFEGMANLVTDALTELGSGCIYGNWCGSGCTGIGGDPIDDLDAACMAHDECLASSDPFITQYASAYTCDLPPSSNVNCNCDAALRDTAKQVTGEAPRPSTHTTNGTACRQHAQRHPAAGSLLSTRSIGS